MKFETASELGQRKLLLASTEYLQPLLEGRKALTIKLMMGRFRAGDKDFLNEIATLVALDDIQMELKRNEQKINNISKETAR